MKHPRTVAGIVAVVVLGGGAAAFVVWRGVAERNELVRSLVEETLAEVEREDPDRDSIRDLLRRVRAAAAEQPEAELVRAEAELLHRVGRHREAWGLIGVVAIAPGATTADQAVAARIRAAQFAAGGDLDVGREALALADGCYRAGLGAGAGFQAWQLAYRIGDLERWSELYDALLAEDPEALEARTVAIATYALAEQTAHRLGRRVADLERDVPDGDLVLVARLLEVSRAAGREPTVVRLRDLEDEWAGRGVPVELDLAIASRWIDRAEKERDPTDRERVLDDARARLEIALEVYPAWLAARHALVVALVGLGRRESTGCQAQIRWLLDNAPAEDVRRVAWNRLRID